VLDPEQLLIRPPFVGWFRTVGPPPDRALTFSLVNLHLDASRPEAELAFLQQLHRAVRNDGRGEDDVILLGDFNAGDRLLDASTRKSQLVRIVTGHPTNTRGTCQYDNILFDGQATVEYLGNSGVFDFLRHFNLTLDQALTISDHLPVWAEFSVVEGGMGTLPRNAGLEPDAAASRW
jgi:endonuclease/exonuclease/phosphatase family metal-dependent hydrolase